MESDRDAFMAAIAANPLDDGLRAIFADWLEEHGEDAEAEKQRKWPQTREESKVWLRNFAEEVGVAYRILMEAADNWLEAVIDGDRWGAYHTLPYDTPDCVYRDRKEFWKHYEIVTGKKVEDYEATFFSCAC